MRLAFLSHHIRVYHKGVRLRIKREVAHALIVLYVRAAMGEVLVVRSEHASLCLMADSEDHAKQWRAVLLQGARESCTSSEVRWLFMDSSRPYLVQTTAVQTLTPQNSTMFWWSSNVIAWQCSECALHV
jgi:hypothetical protein